MVIRELFKSCISITFWKLWKHHYFRKLCDSFNLVWCIPGFSGWLCFVYRVPFMSFSGAKALKFFKELLWAYCYNRMYQFLYQRDKQVLDFKDELCRSLGGNEIKLPSFDLFDLETVFHPLKTNLMPQKCLPWARTHILSINSDVPYCCDCPFF